MRQLKIHYVSNKFVNIIPKGDNLLLLSTDFGKQELSLLDTFLVTKNQFFITSLF